MINWVGQWEVSAPKGLTEAGHFQKLQQETVSRLQSLGSSYASRTFDLLKQGVAATYREGEGTVYESLQLHESRTETGFMVEFLAGGRELPFLTALAGLPFASPGHFIPQSGKVTFNWRNPLYGLPPGIYTFPSKRSPSGVFWRTRRGTDVITDVLSAGAQQFQEAMIAEHNRILVNFVQNDLAIVSKSPRVSVAAGSGIEPQ